MEIGYFPFFADSLQITYSSGGVTSVLYLQGRPRGKGLEGPMGKEIHLWLSEFFDGFPQGPRAHPPIDWNQVRGTAFQRLVWEELTGILWGQTLCYSDVAQRIKKPRAVRAVGGACAQNPLLLVVPCHRVLSRSGWGGFSGGGLSIKKKLLQIEKSLY